MDTLRSDRPVSADAAGVPDIAADAVVDPHWLELRAGELLPSAYMPPTMRGQRNLVLRCLSAVLIGVFVLATALGVCLTYGPP
jgi:hypothetical protein